MYRLATSTWNEKELEAIQTIIDADMYSMGKYVAEYECEFAGTFGSKYAVMVNSGSTANLLMIGSLFFRKNNPLKRGDEIIVPAVSWSTTYAPLQQYGLKVKFVDIDRETLNLDLDKLEDAITEDTKAVLAVNLLGNPLDFDRLKKIIGNRILLEDNCESMGATYKGKQAGTFGLMGSFSSYFSHHISTMEGGCIITDDEELYHILLCMRSHGWTRNLPKENHISNKSDDKFEESFRFVLPGYNVRPLEMSGAIGLEQLKKLPEFITKRRKNAVLFQQLFSQLPNVEIQKETGISSWFGFSLLVKNREKVVKLLEENNIECRPIVSGNFLKNKELLAHFDYEISGDVSTAEYIERHGLFVGNSHEDLTDEITNLFNLLQS